MLQLSPHLAHGLAAQLPWLRVVASLREPISRQLSLLTHNLSKRRADQEFRKARSVHGCLLQPHYLGASLAGPRGPCSAK